MEGYELDSEGSELLQRVYELAQRSRETVVAVDHNRVDLAAPYRYQPWTTEFAKTMSRSLDRTGIEVSPLMLENAIFGYTGGLGKAAMQAASVPLGGGVPKAPPQRTF